MMGEYPVPPEKIVVEDVHPRNICSGKISLLGGEVNIQSRYRGSSVGSCHDLCKYGRRNDDNVANKKGNLVPANGGTASSHCEGLPSMEAIKVYDRLKTTLIDLKHVGSESKSPRGPSFITKIASSRKKVVVSPRIVQPISKDYDDVADKKSNLVSGKGSTTPQCEGLPNMLGNVTLCESLKTVQLISKNYDDVVAADATSSESLDTVQPISNNYDNVADKKGNLVSGKGSTAPGCGGLPNMAADVSHVTLSKSLKTVQPISKSYDNGADKNGNPVSVKGSTAPQRESLSNMAADVTLCKRLKTSVINLKPFGSESKSPRRTSLINKVVSGKKVVVSPRIVQPPSEEDDVFTRLTKTKKLAAPTCRREREREMNKEVREAKGESKTEILVASLVPSSLKPSAKRVAGNGGRNNAYKRDLMRVTGPTRYQNIARKPQLKKPINEEVPEKSSGIIVQAAKYKAKELAQNGATLSSPANGRSSSVNRSRSLSTQLPPISNSKKSSHTGSRISRQAQTLNCGHRLSSATTSSERVKTAKIVNQVLKPIQVNKMRIPRKAHHEISSSRDKFRPGRVVKKQNSQDENGTRMSFRRKEHGGGEPNINKVEQKKVVLRHQDIQGKKDEKILFNNVIRETASKLAETKKSKVLALVGAFETVISLQDVKQLEMDTC